MKSDIDKLIECLDKIAFAIEEHNDTLRSMASDMWTDVNGTRSVHTIAGLMFNSGYALDRLNEISQALQEIQKHHERN